MARMRAHLGAHPPLACVPREQVPDDRRRSAEQFSPLDLLAQQCLEHLAAGVLRQWLGPYDQVLRYLEVGEVLGREGDQLVRSHGASGVRHDDGADLSPIIGSGTPTTATSATAR